MLKAAVISLGSQSSKLTAEAMEKYFDVVDMINIKEIEVTLGANGDNTQVSYQGKPLESYDCAYVKGSFNYGIVAKALTSHLSQNAYVPVNEDAFTIVHDKILTHIALEKSKIPSPKTYLSATPNAAKAILQSISYPVILKFPQGTQGKGVMFADSYAAASSLLDALVSLKQPFLIQEYIETGGTDTRAIVVGDKVVATMNRKAQGDEKRSNIHAGGTGEAVLLDPKARRIAIETAKALKCDICGVDLLQGPRGSVVIEANISPGLQGIMKATGIDVPDKIAQYLYEKTVEFKSKKQAEKHVSADDLLTELQENPQSENTVQQLIMGVDYRGNRMLLPEVISKLAKFEDGQDVVFEVQKNQIHIKNV
ncbi:MAG: ATP-grasp domain-containing protein [Candidatus Woesearchaeota archaeon]